MFIVVYVFGECYSYAVYDIMTTMAVAYVYTIIEYELSFSVALLLTESSDARTHTHTYTIRNSKLLKKRDVLRETFRERAETRISHRDCGVDATQLRSNTLLLLLLFDARGRTLRCSGSGRAPRV